jgi:Protein RETICULATA-related
VQRFLASCPENAFQKVPLGQAPFTVEQRFGAVLRNGFKLLLVGFSASMIGVSITNGLTAIRQAIDPSFLPLNPPQVCRH